MAEINNLLSKDVIKEGKWYLKFLEKANTGYAELMQSHKALSNEVRKQTKTEQTLDAVTKEGNKLLNQRETLLAKQDKSLEKLTKETIRLKEAEKKRLAALKESITGEKAAAEAKKKATIAEREKTKATKAAEQASKRAEKQAEKEKSAYYRLTQQYEKSAKKAKDLAAQYGVNSKQAKKASESAQKYNNQLKKIDASVGQQQRKVGGYFSTVTKSILSVGAGFITIQAALKVFGKLLKTVFLGTQDNIDFFNQKLENVKGQFAVLTDSVSHFGQSLVETFKDSESNVNKLLTPLLKANPLFLAIKANLEALKRLFPETAAAMAKNGEDAERLQKMMDELNEKEVEYIGTKALLVKEMRLSRLEAKKAGDDDAKALMFIDKAIAAEKQLMTLEMEFAVERSRIANERLNLSISTRQDRKEAALLAAKVIELEVASIKKLTTLETERLSLSRRLERQNKKTTASIEENTEALTEYELILKSLGVSEVKFTEGVEDEKYNTVADNIKKTIALNKSKLDQIESDEKASVDRRKELALELHQQLGGLGNVLFDLAQSNRDRELEGVRSNYAARIAAAEGNTEKQDQLTKELARKEAEIQRAQAKSEQNQALFNILAIQTPQNIAKVFPNPILMSLAASIGIIQAGVVKSSPLPEIPAFFAGTDNAPSTFIAGDKYGRELITKKDGSIELTPDKATLFSGSEYKGASILPNSQTERILSGGNNQYDNARLERKLDKVVWAIEKNKTNINISKNAGKLNVNHLSRKYGRN